MELTWATLKQENKSVVGLIRKVLRGQGTVEEESFAVLGCDGNFVRAVATAMVAETQEGQRISGAEYAVCGWCFARIEPGTFHTMREGLLPKRGCEVYPVAGVKYKGVQAKTTQSSDSVPAMAAADLRAKSDGDWPLFHKLWTAAVGTPGYEKELWVKLEGVLDQLKRPGPVCENCKTVIGQDQTHETILNHGVKPPTCAVFHNDFIAVPGEGVGPVAKKFYAQNFTAVPLVSVRTVATAFEIEPLATVTVAGGVGHSDLDIPGDLVRALLGRLADLCVKNGVGPKDLIIEDAWFRPGQLRLVLRINDGQ